MASSQFGGLPVFTAAAIAAAALAAGLTLPALVPAAAVVPRRLGIKTRSQPQRGVLDQHELARRSLTWLIQAFGPGGRHAADTAVGVMVASPSRPEDRPGGKDENECYYFNWPRDTGLCVRALIGALERAEQGLEIGVEHETARRLHGIIKDTVALNMKLQLLPNRSGTFETGGIGEPKYMPDGSAFEDSWGRPQNDGPALRALSYLRYATYLLATRQAGSSELEYISTLYPRGGTPDSVRALVRDDLDFVARVWGTDNTFELWEEVEASPSAGGGHFHVLCVQRAALLAGARFAARSEIADQERAERYAAAAHAVEERMERFWITDGKIEHEGGEAIKEGPMAIEWDDARRLSAISKSTLALPHATPTLQRLGGQQKPTEVDCACVLGFIHGWSGHLEGQDKDLWAPWGERAAATLYRCLLAFRDVYAINAGKELKDGILVGRYPEDVYDGVVQSIGHPWFLTTHGTAELLFISAAHWARLGHVKITPLSLPLLQICDPGANVGTFHRSSDEYERALRGLRSLAEQQLARCRELVYVDGRMDEQIERQTAQQRGARHLSWSYASYLSCWDARDAREART